MKTSKHLLTSGLVAALLLLAGSGAQADNITTTSTISFSPGGTVTEGTEVTLTGNVVCTGTQHTCPTPPIGGKIQIQMLQLGGVGVACGTADAVWSDHIAGGPGIDPDEDGNASVTFDTSGLGGSVIGFRSHYVTPGGGHAPATSTSACLPLTINPESECSGLTIAADLTAGNGTPAPDDSGPWTFRIRVQNCTGTNLTGIKAQGGSNGWAPIPGPFASNINPSAGSYTVKENKKNQVVTWTLNLADGAEATLNVNVNGTIPASSACSPNPDIPIAGTTRYLSGPWSAVYDDGSGPQKSEYTERVSILVTCP